MAKKNEETAVVVRQQSAPMVPVMTFDEMSRAAEAIAKSGLFGLNKPEQVMALGLLSQAEGRPFAIVARDYHIIQGRPALKADAILSRFQESGGKVKWTKFTDQVCEAEFSHPNGGTLTVSWDMARAKQAELTTAMWKKYPRQMLKARVISDGVRACYPAALSGCYTPEEVMDFTATPEKDDVPQTDIVMTTKEVTVETLPPEVKQEPKKVAPKAKPVEKVEAPVAPVVPEKAPELTQEAPKPAVVPEAPAVETLPPAVPVDRNPDDKTPLLDEAKKKQILTMFGAMGVTEENLVAYTMIKTAGWTDGTRADLAKKFHQCKLNAAKLAELKTIKL